MVKPMNNTYYKHTYHSENNAELDAEIAAFNSWNKKFMKKLESEKNEHK